jgi:hypothetical protein
MGVTIFPASTTGPSAINNLIFLASSLFWPNCENPISVPYQIQIQILIIKFPNNQFLLVNDQYKIILFDLYV